MTDPHDVDATESRGENPGDATGETTNERAGSRSAAAEGDRVPGGYGPDATAAAQDGRFRPGPDAGGSAADSEAQILREELAKVQAELADSKRMVAETHDRFLRTRADLDNLRKRSGAEAERARETGVDSAVLPVIRVFDDLSRAITAAEHASDPGAILPGVQAVRDGLERELAALDIQPVGRVGESFDPSLHEALSITPLRPGAEAGIIAEVYEVGFQRGDRLIRPARVVVYSDHA